MLDWLVCTGWIGPIYFAFALFVASIAAKSALWISKRVFGHDLEAEWDAMSDDDKLDIIGW